MPKTGESRPKKLDMRKIILCLTLLITIVGVNAQEAITNKDVIAMKTSKVAEDLIVSKINTGNCNFDLTAEGLGSLKMAKLSDKTIKLMITASSEKPMLTNDDIVAMKTAKISDDIVKHLIVNSPHDFDISTDGLIKLNTVKVSKSVLKDMMSNPVAKTNSTGLYIESNDKTGGNSKQMTAKQNTTSTNVTGICKPFEAPDLVTNEKYSLYGTTFNSGGVIGALAGNSNNSKEMMTVMGGFRGDKTIVLFQLDRVVGENWRNKNNTRDLYIKKGEKIIIVTDDGNMPFYAIEEAHSTYKNELTGINLGSQERISLQAACLATKSQLQKLSKVNIKEVLFTITNGNAPVVKPSKNEMKKFAEKMNCLLQTEKFKDSPETPTLTLTSDEAITELKKAKDKYDLGLITKGEYEAIKTEMKKYIK
jgi:hypothetical protein